MSLLLPSSSLSELAPPLSPSRHHPPSPLHPMDLLSSSPLIGSSRQRRPKRLTREFILNCLEIIGSLPAPLPPDLPSSSPASRSPSPAPSPPSLASSSKRKLDADDDYRDKRPRTSKHSVSISHAQASSAGRVSASVLDDQAASESKEPTKSAKQPTAAGLSACVAAADSALPALTVYQPVRRPRHGRDVMDFKILHKKYYARGRQFKYSGDARFLASFPRNNVRYHALKNPPPENSPYHTLGSLMALLEATESLLCFVYAAWCQDNTINGFNDAWESIPTFMQWCQQSWRSYLREDSSRERAFLGLIHMLGGFVLQRMLRKYNSTLQQATSPHIKFIEDEEEKQKAAKARASNVKLTPPEKSLPSPDTDAATPVNPGDNTPASPNERLDESKRSPPKSAQARAPSEGESSSLASGTSISVTVDSSYVKAAKKVLELQSSCIKDMRASEKNYLTLPTMREQFPRTFGRMVCSTLSADEEYEPDMDDNDGELFWPSQCVSGEGIAWVCLMGRAMIMEFGTDIGYKSIECIIQKVV